MRRISTATRVVDKFGAGKDGFTNGDAVAGLPSTDLEDVWFDSVQEEIANVVEGAGLTLDPANRSQLLAAIQAMFASSVGVARNVKMVVGAASASATLTADEITVGTALGGKKFLLANFNKTINLATTGAGGMDTGTAPVSGFVALYAIYNPTTGTSALLATNATAAIAPNVYGGANMPAGYSASALVSVWPTNASSQFAIGAQVDRWVSIVPVVVIAVTTAQATTTSFSIASAAPKNARSIAGYGACTNGASPGNNSLFLYSSAQQLCTRQIGANLASTTGGVPTGVPRMPVLTAQTLYYTSSSNSSFAANFAITDYEF